MDIHMQKDTGAPLQYGAPVAFCNAFQDLHSRYFGLVGLSRSQMLAQQGGDGEMEGKRTGWFVGLALRWPTSLCKLTAR